MAKNRRAAIAVQAANEGLVDFSHPQSRSKWWRQQYRWKVDEMLRRNQYKIFDAAFRLNLALLSNSSLTEDSFKSNNQDARERYWDMVSTLRPWEGVDYKDRKEKEFTDLRQQYIAVTGDDPLDPEFKRRQAEKIANWLAKPLEIIETEEEAVTRRLQEKSRKQHKRTRM